MIKKINPIHKNFLKYIPDKLLNKEQINAKRSALINDNIRITELKSKPDVLLSINSSAKSLDEMKAERSTLQNEYRELKGQIDNLKASAEYIAFEDEIRKVRKNGSLFGGFEAVKEIRRQFNNVIQKNYFKKSLTNQNLFGIISIVANTHAWAISSVG